MSQCANTCPWPASSDRDTHDTQTHTHTTNDGDHTLTHTRAHVRTRARSSSSGSGSGGGGGGGIPKTHTHRRPHRGANFYYFFGPIVVKKRGGEQIQKKNVQLNHQEVLLHNSVPTPSPPALIPLPPLPVNCCFIAAVLASIVAVCVSAGLYTEICREQLAVSGVTPQPSDRHSSFFSETRRTKSRSPAAARLLCSPACGSLVRVSLGVPAKGVKQRTQIRKRILVERASPLPLAVISGGRHTCVW